MKSAECFCSLVNKVYFIGNFITLAILIIFFLKGPLKDQCLKDNFYNWNLSPIYEIYLSDEQTSESLKLGKLEKYSNINIKIKPRDIYKWKNKYINAKRLNEKYKIKNLDIEDYFSLSPKPINYIVISQNETINIDFNYKTLKIDNNNYLHYSSEYNLFRRVLVDLKISHQIPFTYSKIENNICFAPYCQKTENKCKTISNFIDYDSTDNFIKYNNIEIVVSNSYEFYHPLSYGLYEIDDYYEIKKLKKLYFLYYKLYISLIVINIIMRFIKLVFFCFLKISSKYCSLFNLIILIIHLINLSFVLTIFFLIYNTIDNNSNYNNNEKEI